MNCKWQAKVVMASVTKAQSLNTHRIKIICIEGGNFCDEEHAGLPQIKKEIVKEWTDNGHTTELRLECLWMGHDSFFDYYGHEFVVSKVSPLIKEDSDKTDKANPKERQQLILNNKLPLPPPESAKKLENTDSPKNTKATAEKLSDQSNEKEFSCDECTRLFASGDALLAHLQATAHNVTVYYCDCDAAFSVLDHKPISPLNRLLQHQSSTGHSGIRKLKTSIFDDEWECGECQRIFKTKSARDSHQMATGHRDPPTCPSCKKIFGSQESLEQHLFATGHIEILACSGGPPSSPSKLIQSNQGLLEVSTVPQLKDKLPQNDESEDEEWECGECQKTFKTETAFEDHQTATGHRDPPTCPSCEKTFASQESLEQHLFATGHIEILDVCQLNAKPQNDENEDDDDDEDEWECGECEKTFKTEKAFEDHQSTTGHRDPPTCPSCKKAFGSETALEQHISATGHSKQGLLPVGAISTSGASVKVLSYLFYLILVPVLTVLSFHLEIYALSLSCLG
jgi:uncharacterized C2H2 Zn-finger protein